jgi:hypothetical protein
LHIRNTALSDLHQHGVRAHGSRPRYHCAVGGSSSRQLDGKTSRRRRRMIARRVLQFWRQSRVCLTNAPGGRVPPVLVQQPFVPGEHDCLSDQVLTGTTSAFAAAVQTAVKEKLFLQGARRFNSYGVPAGRSRSIRARENFLRLEPDSFQERSETFLRAQRRKLRRNSNKMQ